MTPDPRPAPASSPPLYFVVPAVMVVVAAVVRLLVGFGRDESWYLLLVYALPLFAALAYVVIDDKPGYPAARIKAYLRENRLFAALTGVILLAVAGFYWNPFYYLAIVLLVATLGGLAFDYYTLWRMARNVSAERLTPRVFSLSDEMNVRIRIRNEGTRHVYARVIDELPFDLQVRDHFIDLELPPGADRELRYPIRPLTRGEYGFGRINVHLSSSWKLAEWHLKLGKPETVPVYPSILQMQQFALRGTTTVPATGRKRMRRLAKSYEFDQIKDYVLGDDVRSINWKATSRRRSLMVNQYEDERAQRVYCFIDKGRTMLMPFAGLSLLDYAINATLALSNVIIRREDRAGLLTFSDKIGTVLPADSKPDHLRRLLEALYRQEDRQVESNYDLLYYASRKLLGGRSLIILFTNFESNYALDRVLPGLRRIAKAHQLVVVLFENTEIAELLEEPTREVDDIYRKATARRFLQQRELMAARLRQNGIKVVLTRPEDLTGEVINKYLELKQRGLV